MTTRIEDKQIQDKKYVAIEDALKSKNAEALAKCDFKMLKFIFLNARQNVKLDEKFNLGELAIQTHFDIAVIEFEQAVVKARQELYQKIMEPAHKLQDKELAELNLKKAKFILKMLKEQSND